MKRSISLALSALFIATIAGPASAGPVPTTSCEIQEFIGVVNVRECQDPVE